MRGGGIEALVDRGIHRRHHVQDARLARAELIQDLRFAIEPVGAVGLDESQNVAN